MRTRLGVTALAVVTASMVAFPATAQAAAVTMVRSPGGGPDASKINVSGSCDGADHVDVSLLNKDSDALSDYGNARFAVTRGGWRGTLVVSAHGGTGPTDLDLTARCADASVRAPFFLIDHTTTARAQVVTSLAGDGCGVAALGNFPCPPHVKSFANGFLASANTYADNGSGGASVAVGNVDGTGDPEIVVGSGPGHDPQVWILNLDGVPISSFAPYDAGFRGGVNVAAADLNGDGKAEIVTGAGPGGGPNVKVFNAAGGLLASFFAYDPGFRGGVNVAAADVNGDGKAELVTGAGPGGGPHVRTFTAGGAAIGGGFFAYDPRFTGGVSVAAIATRIVTGAGPGGGPHVRVFDGASGAPIGGGFFAYDPAFTGGVWVGAGPTTIVTGPGAGGGPHVRTFSFDTTPLSSFFAYEGAFTAGVKVAAVPPSGSGTTSSSGPGGTVTSTPGGTTTSG